MRKQACKILMVMGVLAAPWSLSWADFNVGMAKLSGNLGYSLRNIMADGGRDTTSNQLRGTLNASSYLWQPWFSTGVLRLTAVRDTTEVAGAGSSQTDLLTGDATLNVLPQSHTPFQLTYRASDTRVDRVSLQEVPVSFAATSGFSSDRLGVKQSFLTEAGHRFQMRYDNSHWETDAGGSFDDEALGAEIDLKLVKNRVTSRLSQQNSQNSLTSEDEDRFIVNIEHDYVPSSVWRMDNLLNILNEDRTSTGAAAVNSNSTVDSHQLSSFIFWRPDDRPFTVSGGVRVYGIEASNNTFGTSQDSISGTLGGFYRYSKNVRLDANVMASQIDQTNDTFTQTQQRLGALYQSDTRHWGGTEAKGSIIFPWAYQWYADGALTNRTSNRTSNISALTTALGHNLNRSWRQTQFSHVSLGLSQLVTGSMDNGSGDDVQRLSQSGTLGWNHASVDGGSSTAQLNISDSRDLSNSRDNRQLVNVQLSHDLRLTRQSGLSGSFTAQHVRQNFDLSPDTEVTSLSGRINYHHNRILGVSQLRFLSDMYVSKAELSDSFDRAEWENRLLYAIGQTESQLSLKWIDSESLRYTLFYFRITRNF